MGRLRAGYTDYPATILGLDVRQVQAEVRTIEF